MKATSGEGTLSWFAVPTAQVVKELSTDLDAGLGSGAVSERLEKYGANRLPTAGKRSPLMRFFMQINNVLIYVLLAAAVGKLLLGEWLDASVILVQCNR